MRASVIFETKAILLPESPEAWDLPYFNLVILGETQLSPLELLERLKSIEKAMGRDHQPRWSPRVIDLDILAWDDQVISQEDLTIPHAELLKRPFLIKLMATLKAEWRYPVPGNIHSNLTLDQILLQQIDKDQGKINSFVSFPQMVGIVNVTPDSFSDGGKYLSPDNALQQIHQLVSQGTAIIDIGGQSTRPGSIKISADVEWERLEPVFVLLAQAFKFRAAKPQISLDSYHPEVIRKALRLYPIDWINDVTGGADPRLLQIVADTGCKVVLNHSVDSLPFGIDPISHVCEWAEMKLKQLNKVGIKKERIILDPGIGFGKTEFQSISLIRDIDYLKKYGCEILVGHSRKSFLKIISSECGSERDFETIGVSQFLLRKRIDYLRVHNVEAHQKALTALTLVGGIYSH